MKSVMSFLRHVLNDLGTWCGTSTTRDYNTVASRVEHEGVSFLTITLADLGKELQKALDTGQVDRNHITGFRFSGGLPRFLGGFLDQVFDRGTGRLLDEPSTDAIWAIRQFTLMWSKMLLPCSDERVAAAIGGYIECEKDVRKSDQAWSERDRSDFGRIGTLLWSDAFSQVDQLVYQGDIIPRHSSGATADKLRGNAKWNQLEWTRRLEQVFPSGEHLIPSWRYWQHLERVSILEPGAERPVRVTTVPKTLKTPRIIAIEPTCMQYMQQGLLAELGRAVEGNDTLRRLVSWTSQVPNQHLACEGSRNGGFATLDLSEASDRVSNQHVRVLLRNHRHLAAAVDATRSRKADVPGHGVIRLAKFASMGSALCFPFESMVFITIAFVGIERELNRPLTRKDIESLAGQVRTYGDDIIVPTRFVHAVIRSLEDFGLRVNRNKSFWSGKFRESCGKDYYDGVDVSITRVRRLFPAHRTDALGIVSAVSLRNQLYKAGLWQSARFIDELMEGLAIPFPVVGERSPILGRVSFLGYETQRMHPHLHSPLVKGLKVRGPIPSSKLDGIGALMKCLSKTSDLPFADERHLERAGRPVAVNTKLQWGPSF